MPGSDHPCTVPYLSLLFSRDRCVPAVPQWEIMQRPEAGSSYHLPLRVLYSDVRLEVPALPLRLHVPCWGNRPYQMQQAHLPRHNGILDLHLMPRWLFLRRWTRVLRAYPCRLLERNRSFHNKDFEEMP